jgi:hypothetical protein
MAGSIFRSHGVSTPSPPRAELSSRPVYPHLPASICPIALAVPWQRSQPAVGRFALVDSYPLSVIGAVAECCRHIGLSARPSICSKIIEFVVMVAVMGTNVY